MAGPLLAAMRPVARRHGGPAPTSPGRPARAAPIAAFFETGQDQLAGMILGGECQGPGRSPDRADAMGADRAAAGSAGGGAANPAALEIGTRACLLPKWCIPADSTRL